MKTSTGFLALAALCAAFVLPVSAADPMAAMLRKIVADHGDSVVRITAVMRSDSGGATMSGGRIIMGGAGGGQKIVALGSVVEADGLIVTALSGLDGGREARAAGRDESGADLREIKVVMQDGTEIPAELVLKDADLDLAFIRVKTASKEAKATTFKPLNLKESVNLETGDGAVLIVRGDEALNYMPQVYRGQVLSVLKKPRDYFKTSSVALGCPTFSDEGKLVGIGVNRFLKNLSSTMVMPAADVLEVVALAKKSKPPTEKRPEPKEGQ